MVLCNRILVYDMDLVRNNSKTTACVSYRDSVEREEGEMKWK